MDHRNQVQDICETTYYMGRVKRIWYLSAVRAAKVQASLRIRAVSPEPSLLAHTSIESRGTLRMARLRLSKILFLPKLYARQKPHFSSLWKLFAFRSTVGLQRRTFFLDGAITAKVHFNINVMQTAGWVYTHDSRANKNPYPHDWGADKDSYPQDFN